MIISYHASQAVNLSNAMKKTLETATKDFEAKLELENMEMRPVTITHHPSPLVCEGIEGSETCQSFIIYPYILWDPLTYYHLFKSNPLFCPLCLTNGLLQTPISRTGKWFDSRMARLTPRVLFGTHTPVLLVSGLYRCPHGHEISACHPYILDKLKDVTDIPFLLTHKNGFMLELATLVEDLVDAGLSFDQIEKLVETQYRATYDHFSKQFWLNLELLKPKGIKFEKDKHFFPAFSSENFPRPGNDILIDIFVKRFLINEQLYLKAMNSLSASAMSCDHTFKSACNIGYKRFDDGKWIKQYSSVFCVINERGEIISWQFTKSEGFDEIKHLFLDLKERFRDSSPKIICIDNCCKWRTIFGNIFPDSAIKLDLFHAVQRFVKTLKKKNSVHRDVASDFGKVFRQPHDLGDIRKMPTPNKDTLLANLQNFIKKWENHKYKGANVLNGDCLKAISKIRSHILKNCLSDIPVQCSTSVNERLHKEMKKLLSKNRMGTQLAYAKFTRYFFKHNQLRGGHDSIHSLRSKKCKNIFQGNTNDNNPLNFHFGIRSDERESQGIPPLNSGPYTIDQLTPLVVDDLSKRIDMAKSNHESQNDFSSQPDHSYFDPGKTVRESFDILQHSLSIFKIILLLKSLWSTKDVNILKIPFLFQSIETSLSSETKNPDPQAMNAKERLENLATSFGFTVVQITGDGNCFFRAVAFQLLQILLTSSCPESLRVHIRSLGFNEQIDVEDLASKLRELVVDEWQENSQEYIPFFENMDMQLESERFRNSGEFAGQLGDALPLTMTNILRIPIFILTTVHNMPFVPVIPRRNIDNHQVIFLSYNQEGPGHYDALTSFNLPESSENTMKAKAFEGEGGNYKLLI